MKQIKILSFLFILLIYTNGYATYVQKDTILINIGKGIKKHSELKNYKKVISLCREIIRLNIGNNNRLASDYYRLGFYFKKIQKKDSTYKYFLKSKSIYEFLKDSSKVTEKLFSLAKIESNHGLFYKSDSTAIEALKYQKKGKKNSVIITSIYNILGINSNEQKEYKEAIKWYELALNSTDDRVKKIRYVSNMAVNYKYLRNYEEAILSYKKIINNIHFDSVPLNLKAKVIDNHAFINFLDNQDVNERDFYKAQEIKVLINDKVGLIANYSHLSDFYKESNYSKSLKYAYKMYDLSKKERLSIDRIEAIDRIIELEKASKIREFAVERAYLNDSVQEAKRISRNKLVRIIYNFDNEKRERLLAENKAIQSKKKVIQNKLLIKEQEKEKFIWIFIGTGILLSSILYFFYRKKKEEKEKVIEVYNTEIRLAKKIHDELANDVYLTMNKLQKENRKDTSVLYDLEKIYSLTRNISHENSPVVTGEQFKGFLKQLLLEFSIDTCRVMSKGLSEIQVNSLSKEKQIVMYRILQELLVNMKKHSKANLVVISFSVVKDTIQVQYNDNGVGTNSLEIKNGFQNMETRIKSIGGTVIFESEIQKGFQSKFQFKK